VTSWVTPGHPRGAELAWQRPALLAWSPALCSLSTAGARRGSPVLPSPRTSPCSQGSCKALKPQDSTRPPGWLGWGRTSLFLPLLLTRATKSLQWTSIQKRLMPYVSVLPLQSVPGPSVFIALTLDCPVPAAGPGSAAAPTRRSGRRSSEGWAGTLQLRSPLLWILPREVVLELGPSTCGFLIATSLPLTTPPRPALPLERFLLI